MNPREELEKGVQLLTPLMSSHGFSFAYEEDGKGSGGNFSRGAFISGNKRLELSFRWSLGCVEYHVSDHSISHADYMSAIGKRRESSYPGFSEEPLQAFDHLASDLSQHCSSFLNGSDKDFIILINEFLKKPRKSGLAALY